MDDIILETFNTKNLVLCYFKLSEKLKNIPHLQGHTVFDTKNLNLWAKFCANDVLLIDTSCIETVFRQIYGLFSSSSIVLF